MYSIGTFPWFYNYEDDQPPPHDEHVYEDEDEEEVDGMSDASRNWAKDGVGRLHWGQGHLGAMHDSCN